jgi:hypothetical protein
MNQYNLISPDNNKIYYGTNPKSVATKVFRNLVKNNLNQSRICLEDKNTKRKYFFIGVTNKKLNTYEEIINKKNSNQIGGSIEQIDDKDFLKKLSELSGSINLSIDELVKILKTKYDPESESEGGENNIITLVTEGLSKLDTLNNNVETINKEITAIRDTVSPRPPQENIYGTNIQLGTPTESSGFCNIM